MLPEIAKWTTQSNIVLDRESYSGTGENCDGKGRQKNGASRRREREREKERAKTTQYSILDLYSRKG